MTDKKPHHHMIGDESGRYRLAGKKTHGGSPRRSRRSDARAEGGAPSPDQGTGARTIRAGEIIAFRAWNLLNSGPDCGLLMSMVVPFIWRPKALNKAGGHVDGAMKISSQVNWFLAYFDSDRFTFSSDGFFSFKTMKDAFAQYDGPDIYGGRHPTVFGRIAIWGDVTEHEYGYRSEFAKIHHIDAITCMDPDARDTEIARLNDVYACA